MDKDNVKTESAKTPTRIDVKIPELATNEAKVIVNVNGNYILTDMPKTESTFKNDYVTQATYDMERVQHIYSQILDNDTSSYVTTLDEISSLAKNTQNSIEKILKINGIVKYYINKEDLMGKVVEIIENNINTNYSLNYPYNPKAKREKKAFEEFKDVIDSFNEQINVKKLINDNVISVYTEGNYIYYLRGNNIKDGYSIVSYPLDMIEITTLKIDDDNVVSFNVAELKARLNKTKQQFKGLKSNKLIDIKDIVENEIKRDYPEEVYNAYEAKDKVALLNPNKIGLSRINQLKGRYGVTPIFKALTPQLMLETVDKSDQKVLIQKTKKIYFQSTRSEILSDTDVINKVGYSQASLIKAMGNDTIVYTAMPHVEDLKILEPKIDLTDDKAKLSYKLRILEALGISFISSESSNSITTTKINYSELLKVINRISKSIEPILNKYYKSICEENGFPLDFAPKIVIEKTELLDLDSLLKLVETLYSKIGLSYDSILRKLGLDPTTEINKRIAENNFKLEDGSTVTMDDIMSPHITSFTASGKEGDTVTHNNDKGDLNKNGSKKNEDIDKQESDLQRQESLK